MRTSVTALTTNLVAAAALVLAAEAGAQVIAPPSLGLVATPIAPGAISTVGFTITNPHAFPVQYSFDIPMPYPTVEALGTPPGAAFTGNGCGNGSTSLGNSGTSGTIIVNGGNANTCTYSFYASSTVAGAHTITASTTAPLDTATTSTLLQVYSPPTATVTFSPALILGNQSTLLTLTITNPDPVGSLTLFGSLDLGPLTGYAMGAVGNPAGCLAGGFDGPLYFETFDWQTQSYTPIPAGGACSLELVINNAPPYVPPSPPPPSLPAGSYTVPFPPPPPSTPPLVSGTLGGGDVSIPVSFPISAGVLQVSGIAVSPPTLTFASQPTGTSSPPQAVTVTNVGTASLGITGVSVGVDYTASNGCASLSPLAPYASCSVDVSFVPTAGGTRAGTLTIASDDPVNPSLAVALQGTGSVPGIGLAPAALSFASQTVGTTSSPLEVVLANTGTAPLAISSIATTGDFGHSSNCPAAPSTLAAGATCKVLVTFSPLIVGERTGTLSIASDAAQGSGTASLFGVGVSAALPVPTLSPSPVQFPATTTGTVSPVVPATITNTGPGTLTISSFFVESPAFQLVSNGCLAPVAPGASCPLAFVFAPSTAGTITSTLHVYSNSPESPTRETLVGVAVTQAAAVLVASPPAIDFATQVIGTTSAARAVTIANAGAATAAIGGVTLTGDFAQRNDCGSLRPGWTCTVTVTFTPAATGPRTGSLVISGSAPDAPLSVALSGLGILPANPVIELSVSSLSFGNAIAGVGAPAHAVTVRNTGGLPLSLTEIVAPFEFPVSSRCTGPVAPGGTCQFDVGFQPAVAGTRTGTLTVRSNASNGPASVSLLGTGCRIALQGRVPALVCR